MKKNIISILVVSLIINISLVFLPLPAFASGSNITSHISVIDISLSPGQSFNTTLRLDSSDGISLTLEVDGLTNSLTGAPAIIPAQQDTGSFTARSFITLGRTSVSISAGGTQDVPISINVPSDKAPGERYASIYIYSQPSGQGLSVITSFLIPVIIDTPVYTHSQSGSITDLTVPNTYPGLPINFNTTLQNTGNCRLVNAVNTITVTDSSGNVKYSGSQNITAPSLLPNIPRLITITDSSGLDAGIYTVKSDFKANDGTPLTTTKTTNFTVQVMPAVPSAPTLVSPGDTGTPGTVLDTLVPTFAWNAVSGADYYTLTISKYPYSSVFYTSGQLQGTSFTLPTGVLSTGQSYKWQMTASNAISGPGTVSAGRYFQTATSSTLPLAVSTMPAISITTSGAVLNGSLDGLGSDTAVTVSFNYGPTETPTTANAGVSQNVTGTFHYALTGLKPNTKYYFRAVVTDGTDTELGNILNFTTAPLPTTSPTTTTPPTSTTTTTNPVPTTSRTTTSPPPSNQTAGVPSATTGVAANMQYLLSGMAPSSLTQLTFNNTNNPHLDAVKQADTDVVLNGVNGNGSIIVGKFTSEPSDDQPFSSGTLKGGTGKDAIKFVDVKVEGFIQGTAQVTVHFTDSEIRKYDPNSLFVAYYAGDKWRHCENISVSLSAHSVTGDIPVSMLNGTFVGLGGSPLQTSSPATYENQPVNNQSGSGTSWSLAAVIIVPLVLIGIVVLVIERNRRKTAANGR